MTEDAQRPARPWLPPAPRSLGADHAPPSAPDPWMPVVEEVPGGLISRSQDIAAGALFQLVELRRPDGSVWRAYERRVVLPKDTSLLARVVGEATAVLALAASAVAASDTARMSRSTGWIMEIEAARGSYGARQPQG